VFDLGRQLLQSKPVNSSRLIPNSLFGSAFPDPALPVWRICYWRVDVVGAITPVSLIQTFGNLLEQSPLPLIDTAQEFSQFAIARTFPTFIVGDIEPLPHHLIRGNKYPLLILGPDAGPSVALKGDNRCIEFHLGHSVLPLWPAPLLGFCDFTRFLLAGMALGVTVPQDLLVAADEVIE
jgi:hypothetical protein